jgi:glycosyltransferase involved in cell wall biosynthesis
MGRKVGIIGTVGVPAKYGGFETLAEQLARHIDPRQVSLSIYCERKAYPGAHGDLFEGHRRVFLPLSANGLSSIFYDWVSLAHAALIARVEAVIVLGVSGSFLFPVLRLVRPNLRILCNVDGMEWRRAKWKPMARGLLRALEWCAVKASHVVIADNEQIAVLLGARYGCAPYTVEYGGDHALVAPEEAIPPEKPLAAGFFLCVARVEPENSPEIILRAFQALPDRLVFIGNWSASDYSRALRRRYEGAPNVELLDPVYDVRRLAWYRANAKGYIHGHSVGGTNPSLVEALFWTSSIVAYDCRFNRATLAEQGAYFSSAEGLAKEVSMGVRPIPESEMIRLRKRFGWTLVVSEYLRLSIGSHLPENGRTR